MGQSEVQALVQRLRGVAIAEREGRSVVEVGSAAAVGAALGASDRVPRDTGSVSGTEGGSDPRVSVEVGTTLKELRRVAVHGDATTLDVLLSSEVR